MVGGRGSPPAFAEPFGTEFAFVDGQCRFLTGKRYSLGYRTGTLTSPQAADVARETYWQYLPSLPSLDGVVGEQCPDSSHVVLTDGRHRARWNCLPGRPSLATLSSIGAPLDGPVLVASAAIPPQADTVVRAWPIESDPSGFLPPDGGAAWTNPGVRITNAADVEALRQLRAQDGARNAWTPIWVSRAGGPPYAVHIRDDVPEDMRAAIEAIWAQQRL